MAGERLQNKVAVVTGGGQGIGRAICEKLVQEGAKVVVADIDADSAAAVAHQLGVHATPFKCDVKSVNDIKAMVKHAVQEYGRLDVLVNNAACFVFADIANVNEAEMEVAYKTNVHGYTFAIQHALHAMKQNLVTPGLKGSKGSIVNLASISSFRAQPGFVPYSTSKGAIAQLTRAAALDCGVHNIRVNAVCPGPILTSATQRHAASEGKSVQQMVQETCSHLVIKRMGAPEEVANAVAFLASDEASFITGTCLMVDGGYSIL
eukprot:jgi/Chrzof1/9572/Cz04g07380.t1